jgi:antitoxin component YwqK of YwqJK toxin-antitoxin module
MIDRKISYYPNGQIQFDFPLKDGKRHGRCLWFFENGNLKALINHTDGLWDGLVCFFYENKSRRHLWFEKTNVNGYLTAKHGIERKFNEQDVCIEEIKWEANKIVS